MNQNNISKNSKTHSPPYPRIYMVLNPAAGGDEPILNTINDVFYPAGIEWDVGITNKYGDAQKLARQAAKAGYDLVAGYGGDGTQHEVANPYTEHFKKRILKFEEEWNARNG